MLVVDLERELRRNGKYSVNIAGIVAHISCGNEGSNSGCSCGDQRVFFLFEEQEYPLSHFEYTWMKDDQFCPDRMHLEALVEERKDWLENLGFEYADYTNLDIYYPLLDDHWVIYLDGKRGRAIGISSDNYYIDTLRKALSLGYLKASYEASPFCLLLHAAGIVVDGHCFIFPALSGMGKTAISLRALESGLRVLSDEYIVVTETNGVFMAHPTPFGEVGNETKPYPISGIVMLCKDSKNQIRTFPWLEGFLRTWHGEFYYRLYYTHGNYAEKLFSQLMDLYRSLPCFYLSFTKDFKEWNLLLDALSGAPLEVFSILELKETIMPKPSHDR